MKAFNVIWAVQCNSLSVLHYRFGIHWSKTFEKRVSSQSWTHLLKTFETNFPIPLSSQRRHAFILDSIVCSSELKLILTNVALERLPSFMNWCYVNILNDFLPPWTDAKWLFKLPFCVCKTITTIITLGILLSLMDCCYVSIQVSISCITNIEF